MADLLALSSRVIDSGVVDEPINRVTNELSEVADGLAIVESFSHSVVIDAGDGLVAFDASHARHGADIVRAIQGWRSTPVSHLVYTHGHADHVGGGTDFAPCLRRDDRRRPPQRRRHASTGTGTPTIGTC